MRLKNLLLICFFTAFQTLNAQSLYVDASRVSSGAGTSWSTAYKTLSEALNTAWQNATIATVYVAKGSYAPTNYPYVMGTNKLGTTVTSAVTGYTLTNYDKTFHIRTGLEVYGGYPAGGGVRNLVGNETILNANSTSNHVVVIDSSVNWTTTSDTTILDGFTIMGGYANNALAYTLNGSIIFSYSGAGIYALTGSIKLQNNMVKSNTCTGSSYISGNNPGDALGGGIYNSASTIFIKNYITNNTCVSNTSHAYGGGVYSNKAASFFNNIVSLNTASSVSNSTIGGGISIQAQNQNATSTLIGNFIIANKTIVSTSSYASGGGLYLYAGYANITNNVISGNSCAPGYGGGVYTGSGVFTFNNNVFTNNYLTGYGLGGAFTSAGYVNQGVYNTINFVNNSIFWGNSGNGAPDVSNEIAIMNVKNTILQLPATSYTSSNLLGLANPDKNLYAADPLFVNANNIAGSDGVYGTSDDGLALQKASPAVNAGNNYLVPIDLLTDIINNARIQDNVVDMGAYERQPIILPLALLNFIANHQGFNNLLQWATSNEVGSKAFVVESSANGISFTSIGNVAATGDGMYSFVDNNPITNRTYYRLKMMDVDGNYTYSNIVWVSSSANASIGIYPNPVKQITTLDIGNNSNLVGSQAQLTDLNGRLLRKIDITHNQQQIDMTVLPAGLYYLKVKSETMLKIIKL